MFIETASPSKINTYKQCQQKYKLYYNDKLPQKFNKTLDVGPTQWGSYIHKIFEEGYELQDINELAKVANDLRPNYVFKESKLKTLPKFLKNFLRFNAKIYKTLEVEYKFKVEFESGMTLNGIIDRIAQTKDGKLVVIDYKTGKGRKNKLELAKDVQLLSYAYAIGRKYKIGVDKILVCHYYPEDDKLVGLVYTNRDISAFLYRMKQQFWDIRKKKAADCKPSTSGLCDWCGFKEICPAFNSEHQIKQRIDEHLKEQGDNKD